MDSKDNGNTGTARSYKGSVIGDNLSLHINVKWLIQLLVAVAMLVYGLYQLETRIQALERNMVVAQEEIELQEEDRKKAEKKHIDEIQEQLEWYESELNLNPFSWGKKKKGK